MALRIGGGMPQMDAASQPAMMPPGGGMPPPEMAPPPVEDMPPEMPMEDPTADLGKVSQESARYFGPEYRCAGCVHFIDGMGGQPECEIVAGVIDPQGVCFLFEPDVEGMTEEMPDDGLEAEMPMDGPEDEGMLNG